MTIAGTQFVHQNIHNKQHRIMFWIRTKNIIVSGITMNKTKCTKIDLDEV